MRESLLFRLPIPIAAILLIAGCANSGPAMGPTEAQLTNAETCRANCATPIELPAETGRAPTVAATTRIAGGQVLDFNLRGQTRTNARTVLAFKQAAFLDQRGNPIYSLELTAGNNRFESRRYEDGVCHAPRGCRYVVINFGTPTRPPIINSPILIIEP